MAVLESADLTHGSNRGDRLVEGAVTVMAAVVPLLLAGIVFLLMVDALLLVAVIINLLARLLVWSVARGPASSSMRAA